MPSFTTRNLKQHAVLWPYSGIDRHGQPVVSATYVQIPVRIEGSVREVLESDASAVAKEYTLMVDRVVVEGSVIWFGKTSQLPDDLGDLTSLYEVIEYTETPNIKAKKFTRVIQIKRYGESLPATA